MKYCAPPPTPMNNNADDAAEDREVIKNYDEGKRANNHAQDNGDDGE